MVLSGGRGSMPYRTGEPGKNCVRGGSELDMTTKSLRTPPPCQTPGPPIDVVSWRICRLLEHGFPQPLAEELAHQRVDLHALLQLVDAGCPPHLAARILAPMEDVGEAS
jgi:hypothetical protein